MRSTAALLTDDFQSLPNWPNIYSLNADDDEAVASRSWADFAKAAVSRASVAERGAKHALDNGADGVSVKRSGLSKWLKNKGLPKSRSMQEPSSTRLHERIRSEPVLHTFADPVLSQAEPQDPLRLPATAVMSSGDGNSRNQLPNLSNRAGSKQLSRPNTPGSFRQPENADSIELERRLSWTEGVTNRACKMAWAGQRSLETGRGCGSSKEFSRVQAHAQSERRRNSFSLMQMQAPATSHPSTSSAIEARQDKASSNMSLEERPADKPTASLFQRPRQASNAVHALAHELRMPFDDVKRAADIFERYAEIPIGETLAVRMLKRHNFSRVLCELGSAETESELCPEFLTTAFNFADRDRKGEISLREFLAWFASFSFSEEMTLSQSERETRVLARKLGLEVGEIDRYKRAFDKFDTDSSGTIDQDEFKDLLYVLLRIPAGQLSKERFTSLWRRADLDGNGTLDFEEFCVFYVQHFDKSGAQVSAADIFKDFYKNIRPVPAFA